MIFITAIFKLFLTGVCVFISSFWGHNLVTIFLVKMGFLQQGQEDYKGKIIGYLERAIVTLFVLNGLMSQTVFIFAIKAAVMTYRISLLEKEEQKDKAEYMLIGTMFSYLTAIVIGLLGRMFI
jgi:hypothetical protein